MRKSPHKYTEEESNFILKNRLSMYNWQIAEELGLTTQQVRDFLKYRNLDRKRRQIDELTEKELEVYKRILTGVTIHKIADELFSSVNTIATHFKNITRKKMVNTRAELMALRIKELEDELYNTRQVLNSYHAGQQ